MLPKAFSGFILSEDKGLRHLRGESYAKSLAELQSCFASKKVILSFLEKDISYVLLQLGVAGVGNNPEQRWIRVLEKRFSIQPARVLPEIKTNESFTKENQNILDKNCEQL